MNVAVLFDSAEEDSKINHPKLQGREIYLYALKVFYMHSDIDCIFYICEQADTLAGVFEYISAWGKESAISKPVKILHGIRHFSQIWLHILQSGLERPAKYVIHDVRFPFVTEPRITDVIQMAGEHGIAMFSGYPVAVRAESQALHCLDNPRFILRDLSYYEPWLCEDSEGNIAVYDSGDIERAEGILIRSEGAAV